MTRPGSRLNPLSRFQEKRSLEGIYSVKEFHAVLEHECARSDRTGRRLSLIVFDIGDGHTDQTAARRLAHVLTQRIRSIDEVGWFDTWRLGVVLPDTPAEGARNLAQDICKKIANIKPSPVFKIYSYPSEWLPGSKENSPNHTFTKIECKGEDPQTDEVKICNSGNLAEKAKPLLHCRMPAWKRGMDIFGSGLGLLLLFPLFVLISILIKIVSPSPIFFKGERAGYLMKPFNCWKFRTMHANSNNSPHKHHVVKLMKSDDPYEKLDDNDDRIIPFGKLLRNTGLDEIPQLINILRGEMSLVGPRPELPYSVRYYTQWQKRRFDAVPGLTGLWQTGGKNRTTFKGMIRFDITYTQQRSFLLDLKILLKTVPVIICQVFDSLLKRKDEEHAHIKGESEFPKRFSA